MSGGEENRTVLGEGEDPLAGMDEVDVTEERSGVEENVVSEEKEDEIPLEEEEVPKEKAAIAWNEAWSSAGKQLPLIKIGVDSPETVGNALNRHVVYRVYSEMRSAEGVDIMYEVRRRFSDFIALRESLVKRYCGLYIPPTPPKVVSISPLSSKSAEESTLVQSRLRLLSDFAEGLGTIPFIADDPALFMFCSHSASDDTNTSHWLKLSEEQITKNFPTPGSAMWSAALSRSPQPPPIPQLEKVLNDVTNRLDSLQSSTDIAFKAAHKASLVAMSRADALFALKDGFQPWRGESARWSALALSLPDKLSPSLADPTMNTSETSAERGAAAISAALDAYAREADAEPTLFEKNLAAACQYQQLSILSIKELIAKRTTLTDELRKQQKHLDSLHSLKAAGKTPTTKKNSRTSRLLAGFSPTFSSSNPAQSTSANEDSTHPSTEPTIDELIDEAQRTLTEREHTLDLHARALCYCELDRFKRDYTTYQNKWAAAFFTDMTNLADSHKRCWENAHDALGIQAPV